MKIRTLITAFLICLPGYFLFAQQDSTSKDKLTFTADTRLRLESDWNRTSPDGQMKSDRARMRFRFRFGFDYQWSQSIKFGARMRSGYPEDQQSPHWTLG